MVSYRKKTNPHSWQTMVATIYFLALMHVAECSKRIRSGKIIKDPKESPFVAFITLEAPDPTICSGSIISKNHILTAAHCLSHDSMTDEDVTSNLRVKVGLITPTETVEELLAAMIFRHPQFDPKALSGKFLHDIGIILLESSLSYDISVKRIKFASLPELLTHKICDFYGWGQVMKGINTDAVKKLEVMISDLDHFKIKNHTRADCPELLKKEFIWVRTSRFSAICKGDDGGPLIHNDEVIGVASKVSNDCTLHYPLNMFTSVPHHFNWINQVIETSASLRKSDSAAIIQGPCFLMYLCSIVSYAVTQIQSNAE